MIWPKKIIQNDIFFYYWDDDVLDWVELYGLTRDTCDLDKRLH